LTFYCVFSVAQRPAPHSFPTRRSSDLFLPPTLMMTLRPTLPGLTRPFTRALPPRTTLAFGSFALVFDFTRIRLAPVSRSAPPGLSRPLSARNRAGLATFAIQRPVERGRTRTRYPPLGPVEALRTLRNALAPAGLKRMSIAVLGASGNL